ncbi:MAG: cyclic nucleotide-binding domain-containing protein [Pseudomonadales bacterium]|nr:cyclic nucleotide-binding domain-containing protein [Pseudomonadales bacterium]
MNLDHLFDKSSETLSLKAGEMLFEQGGEAGESMFVVLEGQLELQVNGAIVETVEKGGMLGEMSMIEASKRSASAIAKTDCRLAVVGKKRFLFMVQETPFFALHVMRVLVNRLRHMDKIIA